MMSTGGLATKAAASYLSSLNQEHRRLPRYKSPRCDEEDENDGERDEGRRKESSSESEERQWSDDLAASTEPVDRARALKLRGHDERWRHMSELAGSHRQDNRVLKLSRRFCMSPQSLRAGVPPQAAARIRELHVPIAILDDDDYEDDHHDDEGGGGGGGGGALRGGNGRGGGSGGGIRGNPVESNSSAFQTYSLKSQETDLMLPEWLDVISSIFLQLEHLYLTAGIGDGTGGGMGMGDDQGRRRSLAAIEAARMRRLYVLYRLPHLLSIDGMEVTDLERQLARPDTPNGHRVNRNEWVRGQRRNAAAAAAAANASDASLLDGASDEEDDEMDGTNVFDGLEDSDDDDEDHDDDGDDDEQDSDSVGPRNGRDGGANSSEASAVRKPHDASDEQRRLRQKLEDENDPALAQKNDHFGMQRYRQGATPTSPTRVSSTRNPQSSDSNQRSARVRDKDRDRQDDDTAKKQRPFNIATIGRAISPPTVIDRSCGSMRFPVCTRNQKYLAMEEESITIQVKKLQSRSCGAELLDCAKAAAAAAVMEKEKPSPQKDPKGPQMPLPMGLSNKSEFNPSGFFRVASPATIESATAPNGHPSSRSTPPRKKPLSQGTLTPSRAPSPDPHLLGTPMTTPSPSQRISPARSLSSPFPMQFRVRSNPATSSTSTTSTSTGPANMHGSRPAPPTRSESNPIIGRATTPTITENAVMAIPQQPTPVAAAAAAAAAAAVTATTGRITPPGVDTAQQAMETIDKPSSSPTSSTGSSALLSTTSRTGPSSRSSISNNSKSAAMKKGERPPPCPAGSAVLTASSLRRAAAVAAHEKAQERRQQRRRNRRNQVGVIDSGLEPAGVGARGGGWASSSSKRKSKLPSTSMMDQMSDSEEDEEDSDEDDDEDDEDEDDTDDDGYFNDENDDIENRTQNETGNYVVQSDS